MLLLLQLNNYEDDDYYELTKDKIRLMLSLASKNGIKNIILGSWDVESLIIIQL
jgi:hypothetical protein